MTEAAETQRPQCILCKIVFSNANLKPSRVNERFNNGHEGWTGLKQTEDQAGTI